MRVFILLVFFSGMLCSCSNADEVFENNNNSVYRLEDSSDYYLPNAEHMISETEFQKLFSKGEWYLFDVTNVMEDGSDINRRSDYVDGSVKEVPLFVHILGKSPTSFVVTGNNKIKEKGISDANQMRPFYYDGIFSYDEHEGLLTIRTGSGTEVEGKHRLMAVSEDELIMSGKPYWKARYPNTVYAIYVYHHTPFKWE